MQHLVHLSLIWQRRTKQIPKIRVDNALHPLLLVHLIPDLVTKASNFINLLPSGVLGVKEGRGLVPFFHPSRLPSMLPIQYLVLI